MSPLLLLLAVDLAGPRLPAVRAPSPPLIDGRLDDEVWKLAIASDRFVQQWPSEGAPPSERTTMRILYDDDALYVAFDCDQVHAPIARRLTRRDQDSESDWVQVQLDTRRDGKTAFLFAVNVSGVLADAAIRNQSIVSLAWDENWEGQTAITSHGWSAELRIPLRVLRFDSNVPVQSWGLQAARIVSAAGEAIQWSLVPRSSSDWVSRFGKLDDLRDLKQSGRLELRPFVTVRAEGEQQSAYLQGRSFGLVEPSWQTSPAGLDLKWHLTQDLTVDGAILPEFGQVEADRLILNLTNYETFLPEKRPLFLEGAETLSTPEEDTYRTAVIGDYFPNRLFYSRRIGAAPAIPALAGNERVLSHPQPSVIYGAGKLTGQLGPRYSIGALSVFTGENLLATNQRQALIAAPATAFNVLRVRRDFASGHFGLIGTATSRLESADPAAGDCASGDTRSVTGRCFHDAYVAGLDGGLRFGAGQYTLASQLTATRIEKGPTRTLADGTLVAPGASGLGLWTHLAKEGGAHVVWSTEYTGQSRRLDYNDAGFMARQNLHQIKASIEYRTLTPQARVIETHLRLDVVGRQTLDGLNLGRLAQLNQLITFAGLWTLSLTAGLDLARFDDREIGERGALNPGTTASLERARTLTGQLDLGTDPRRRLVGWITGVGQLFAGGYSLRSELSVTAHPLPQLDLAFEPQFTYTRGEPRFATTEGDLPNRQYVLGSLLAKSAGTILRASYTFTPRLTLQAYAQLFLASGHYSDLRTVAGTGGQIRLGDIAAAPPSGLGPNTADFAQAALNANVVLRWEYRLGALIYLVYARSQIPTVDDLGGASGDLRWSSLRHGGAANVVLLKLSYWWAS